MSKTIKPANIALDEGFDEVPLDDGFVDVPLTQSGPVKEQQLSTPEEDEGDSGSNLKDMALGGAQGATLGFADELYGGLGAGKAALTGNVSSLSDLLSKYREYQQEGEKAYADAKERSPILTGVAELAGGFAVPGLGSASAIKNATGLARIGQAMKAGAIAGTVGGLGFSDKKIDEDASGLAKDAAAGAAIGGAIGGATSSLGNLGKYFTNDSPTGAKMKIAQELGEEGKKLGGLARKADIVKETEALTQDVAGKFKSAVDIGNKEYGQILKNSLDNVTINPEADTEINKSITALIKRFENSDGAVGQNIASKLQKLQTGGLNVNEAKGVYNQIGEMLSTMGNDSLLPDAKLVYNQVLSGLQRSPDYVSATAKFKAPRALEESFLGRGEWRGDKNADEIAKKIKNTLIKNAEDTKGGRTSFENILNLEDNLVELQKTSPDSFKALNIGDDIKGFIDKFKKQSTTEDLYDRIYNRSAIDNHSSSLNPMTMLSSFSDKGLYGGANLAGRATRQIEKLTNPIAAAINKPAELGKIIMNPSNYNTVIKQLSGSKDTAHYAQALINAKGQAARNAILFTIAQSPTARDVMSTVTPEALMFNKDE